jgi:hypothetical protein
VRIRLRYSIASILLLTAVVAVALQLMQRPRGLIGTWVPADPLSLPKDFAIRFDGEFLRPANQPVSPTSTALHYRLSTVNDQKFIDIYGDFGKYEMQHCTYSLRDDLLIIDAIEPRQNLYFHWKLKRAK